MLQMLQTRSRAYVANFISSSSIQLQYIALVHDQERMQKQTKPKALAWSWPSHVAVFVRNLQLLKLDQQPDWPGITVRRLSPSSQNQRQRTKAVEWALYHLCAIWDPAATQDVCIGGFTTLRPFGFFVYQAGRRTIKLTLCLYTARNSGRFSRRWKHCSRLICGQLCFGC